MRKRRKHRAGETQSECAHARAREVRKLRKEPVLECMKGHSVIKWTHLWQVTCTRTRIDSHNSLLSGEEEKDGDRQFAVWNKKKMKKKKI